MSSLENLPVFIRSGPARVENAKLYNYGLLAAIVNFTRIRFYALRTSWGPRPFLPNKGRRREAVIKIFRRKSLAYRQVVSLFGDAARVQCCFFFFSSVLYEYRREFTESLIDFILVSIGRSMKEMANKTLRRTANLLKRRCFFFYLNRSHILKHLEQTFYRIVC